MAVASESLVGRFGCLVEALLNGVAPLDGDMGPQPRIRVLRQNFQGRTIENTPLERFAAHSVASGPQKRRRTLRTWKAADRPAGGVLA